MQNNTFPIELPPEEMGAAIKAYMAESCPACEGEKARRMDPFCADCFAKLPKPLRERISDRSNFIETYHPAIKYLSDGPNGSAK